MPNRSARVRNPCYRKTLIRVADIPATVRLIRSLADSVDGDKQMLSTLLDLLPVGVAIAHDPQCKTLSLNRAAALRSLRLRSRRRLAPNGRGVPGRP